MDNTAAKEALRQQMAQLRSELTSAEREMKSKETCRHAAEWLSRKEISSVMLYMPFRSELDTKPLIEWCWRKGIHAVLPKVHPDTRSMSLYRLDNWEGLTAGAYGIMEPDPKLSTPFDPHLQLDVVFVPGLAFDGNGGRLGYGGGYYDRFAERAAAGRTAAASACWLGIGFELQMLDELPMQKHDRRMDGIVTEEGLRLFSSE